MKKVLATVVAGAIVGVVPITASAVNFKDVMSGDVDFSIGGYVKLNVMATDFSDGDGDNGNNLLSTFYFPGGIPVGDGSAEEDNNDLQFSARESRINFKASKKMDGHSLMSYLEIDFMPNGDGSGNEIISNSYSPRLRHAFLKFDNWLFGQTWSTYMDTGALPESVDFLAVSESTVFVRQPQVRYSSGAFQVALENPESFVTGIPDRDDNELPDLIANYKFSGDWGHVRLNGVLRKLETETTTTDDSATGWGIGVTGKVMVGRDDIKFSLNHGEGMAKYIALALVSDGTIDSNGDIDTSETTTGFVAYRHWWTDKWRSSFMYGFMDTDYDASSPIAVTSEVESYTVNLMYSPAKKLDLGIMYIDADRELDNGTDGDMKRVQFSAKYAF